MSRIAVYLCDCVGQISDHVDLESLEAVARGLQDVLFVRRLERMCGAAELGRLTEEIHDNNISRLLVGACSPRMSLKLPEQRLLAAAAHGGVDPALVEVVNLREQCAWIHRTDRGAASAKARDMLRMAHARLQATPRSPAPVELRNRVLVVGAGPAGLAAARDLGAAGVEALLVERSPWVGGVLCELPTVFQNESWPSTCEQTCIGPAHAQQALLNPLVQLHASSRVEQIVKREGNFRVVIERDPRYVDADRCLACGKCAEACPVPVNGHRAISRPFPRALPEAYVVSRQACPEGCEACAEACPTGAIDLTAQPTQIERRVGAVILATGTRQRDPGLAPIRADGSRHPDVVTALEFESILHAPGGLRRPSDGQEVEHVCFVQCAGSRVSPDSSRAGVPYCSKTCCAVTAKQAKRVATVAPMTEVSVVYYRDFRAYERALEKLHQDLRSMGVPFVNGEVARIDEGDEGLAVQVDLLAREEDAEADPDEQHTSLECDLVVLACAQEPQLPGFVAPELGVPLDRFGFPIEQQPRALRPTETFVDRVYAVGSTAGPKTIQQAVEQGSAAALRAIDALSAGLKQPVKHFCQIDRERCSGCGVCLSVCPHGAIRATDDGTVADPAFCQGCGMCAASCPAHAASLSGFSDDVILAQVREAFREAPAGEPRILALLCYWCGYGGVDMAGILRIEASTCFRPLRIRCSSSVNTGLLFEMFRMGVDGVIVAGCPHNSCHHMWGNWLAEKRVSLARSLMGQMGLEEARLVFENIGLIHGPRFVELVNQKRDELLALGPSPLTRPGASVVEGGMPSWQAR